jgi:hypothetical protein
MPILSLEESKPMKTEHVDHGIKPIEITKSVTYNKVDDAKPYTVSMFFF